MNTSWSGTRQSFPRRVRDLILTRTHYTCQSCGHHDPTGKTLVADHIIPTAEGGTDHPDNGQALCTGCHDVKTKAEQARGRARIPTRHRPTQQHPGLTDPH